MNKLEEGGKFKHAYTFIFSCLFKIRSLLSEILNLKENNYYEIEENLDFFPFLRCFTTQFKIHPGSLHY